MRIRTLKGWPRRLGPRDIHVWSFRVAGTRNVADRFYSLLSPDEQERAERFRFERLRDSYATSRGILRVLLGQYLRVPPAAVEFSYGTRGKPALNNNQALQFNASHSGELVVLAFTDRCPVGVDVEQLRPFDELEAIAERFFSREELAELTALPAHQRERGFFSFWTRREAYTKATGDGLSAPLENFSRSLSPGELETLLPSKHDYSFAGLWSLENLSIAPGYAAALAYRDYLRPVCLFPTLDSVDLWPFE